MEGLFLGDAGIVRTVNRWMNKLYPSTPLQRIHGAIRLTLGGREIGFITLLPKALYGHNGIYTIRLRREGGKILYSLIASCLESSKMAPLSVYKLSSEI